MVVLLMPVYWCCGRHAQCTQKLFALQWWFAVLAVGSSVYKLCFTYSFGNSILSYCHKTKPYSMLSAYISPLKSLQSSFNLFYFFNLKPQPKRPIMHHNSSAEK